MSNTGQAGKTAGYNKVYNLVTGFLPGGAASDTSRKLMGVPYTTYALDDAQYQTLCDNCAAALQTAFGYAAGLPAAWRMTQSAGSADDFIDAVYKLLTTAPANG